MTGAEEMLAHGREGVPDQLALHVLLQSYALEGATAIEILAHDLPAVCQLLVIETARNSRKVARLFAGGLFGIKDDVRCEASKMRVVVD